MLKGDLYTTLHKNKPNYGRAVIPNLFRNLIVEQTLKQVQGDLFRLFSVNLYIISLKDNAFIFLYNVGMKNVDEKYMKQVLKLALRGKGKVAPNPMVGCIVLDKNGNVVSKGYHKKYGQNHAERDALLKLKNNEAEGGTLYVNLEPCSHFGKTLPCTDLIIERKIKRVVIDYQLQSN